MAAALTYTVTVTLKAGGTQITRSVPLAALAAWSDKSQWANGLIAAIQCDLDQ